MDTSVRTVLMIGAAMLAGEMIVPAALAQSDAAHAPPPPAPAAPRCIMRSAADCKLADGHPDLTGLWVLGGPPSGLASGDSDVTFGGRGGSFVGFEADGGLYRESQVDSGDVNAPNMPHYKPEFWDKIVDLDFNGNSEDPQQYCMPPGLPRLGAPAQIISLKEVPMVLLFYTGGYARDVVRQVWTDGRPHNPLVVAAETWNGDPVGHWEGDTLVIESIGFTDASWMHKNGYLHGFNMKVTERLKRTGNILTWEATVEDPDYLVEPWTLTPVTRFLNSAPNAQLVESLPCLELDRDHIVSHARNG